LTSKAIAMEKIFYTILMTLGLFSAAVAILALILFLVFFGYLGFEAIARKIGIGKPDIIRAIESGDLDIVRSSLQKDPKWIKKKYYGDTILYLSTESNKSEIVKFLLEKGADINQTSRNSRLPIHAAISHGNLELVQAFVRAGSHSSLRLATIYGNYEISKFLVVSGADINELYFDPFDRLFTEKTPLDYAYESKNKLLIDYLLEHGAMKALDLNRSSD
jgi:ankyrin repeat protein